jgi:hypothetical protein
VANNRLTPGVATMNKAVESLNATVKKYFTSHKWFKLGKFCFIMLHYNISFYFYINVCNVLNICYFFLGVLSKLVTDKYIKNLS